MPIDMETRKNAERAVLDVESCKRTITTVRDGIREQMPDAMQALEDAELELPKLQETAKVPLRLLGAGNHEILGHHIDVKAAPIKVEVDVEGLVDRATDRGDINDLLDAGVLKYEVVPHQIARLLDGKMRAIYESYLKQKVGTASVTLPPELK